jgi:lipoate-protein ligase A
VVGGWWLVAGGWWLVGSGWWLVAGGWWLVATSHYYGRGIMLFVDNQNITDPRLNLAIEEHLLRNVHVVEPILFFYVNEPSVIIGRNQNTLEEIDPDYVEANAIHVVRRLSGGGAVYHDKGNLNFSFVTNGREDIHNFAKFTEPVIMVLRQCGVAAEMHGQSDIFAGGKKVSGNAQYSAGQRMFSHGTLLYDSDLERMLKSLNPRQLQIESKAVQSVRNFVTNIRELLVGDLTIEVLKMKLLHGIFGSEEIPTYELTVADWQQIETIADARYRLWEWNFGRSPQFNVQKSEQLTVGKVDVRIDVAEGHIQAIKIFGNFTGSRDVAELEQALTGSRYDRQALGDALRDVDITLYFGELQTADFLALLY